MTGDIQKFPASTAGRSCPAAASQRDSIAEEAAHQVLDEGVEEYGKARARAVEALGGGICHGLPDPAEIERAVQCRAAHHWDDETESEWQHRLDAALEAMGVLSDFSPRLVGALTRRLVLLDRRIQLHVFADTPEELLWFLEERRIRSRAFDRNYADRRNPGRRGRETRAMFRFLGPLDVDIEATVFEVDRLHHAPASPIDGRPITRFDRRQARALQAEPVHTRTAPGRIIGG